VTATLHTSTFAWMRLHPDAQAPRAATPAIVLVVDDENLLRMPRRGSMMSPSLSRSARCRSWPAPRPAPEVPRGEIGRRTCLIHGSASNQQT
jgi:hypothetical protein